MDESMNRKASACWLPRGHPVQREKERSGEFYYEDLKLEVIFRCNTVQSIDALQLPSIWSPGKRLAGHKIPGVHHGEEQTPPIINTAVL